MFSLGAGEKRQVKFSDFYKIGSWYFQTKIS